MQSQHSCKEEARGGDENSLPPFQAFLLELTVIFINYEKVISVPDIWSFKIQSRRPELSFTQRRFWILLGLSRCCGILFTLYFTWCQSYLNYSHICACGMMREWGPADKNRETHHLRQKYPFWSWATDDSSELERIGWLIREVVLVTEQNTWEMMQAARQCQWYDQLRDLQKGRWQENMN